MHYFSSGFCPVDRTCLHRYLTTIISDFFFVCYRYIILIFKEKTNMQVFFFKEYTSVSCKVHFLYIARRFDYHIFLDYLSKCLSLKSMNCFPYSVYGELVSQTYIPQKDLKSPQKNYINKSTVTKVFKYISNYLKILSIMRTFSFQNEMKLLKSIPRRLSLKKITLVISRLALIPINSPFSE